MSVLLDAKQQILKELKSAIGKEYSPELKELLSPPDLTMGDIAFPCFVLAKAFKKAPNEIAIELAAKIGPKQFVKKVKADGPYVNFVLSEEVFGAAVLEEVRKEKGNYGKVKEKKEKRIMVEFAQPNTHKSLHVGHLRNFLVGQMVSDVLKANAYEVIPTSYINDLGRHVAQSIWCMKKFHKDEEVPKETRVQYLADVYAQGAKKSKDNKKAEKEISEIFQNLEEMQGDDLPLWKETRKWSIDYFKSVFKELGMEIDAYYFESELLEETRAIIEALKEKGIAEESEGALIVRLEEENLGVFVLVRSDGTLLYTAKDLALAMKKDRDYNLHRSLYVIDARQALAMKQAFTTLAKNGFEKELEHISYEFVTTPEGAMASRTGNVIRYEDLRDEMLAFAKAETAKRHEDWSDEQVEAVAHKIAFAALRFGMLKQDLDKKIVFDMKEALSFEGFTGPYLLYTYARAQSIVKKAGKVKKIKTVSALTTQVEHELLVQLAQFPEVVFKTGKTLQLSAIAQYVFSLAQTFAEFYHAVPVLQEENETVRMERLSLVQATMQVLENGLALMGIEVVEEM
jgi:arginyl-tRNA synthetase